MLELARQDLAWGAHVFDLKRGTLKFLMNSSIDCLATQANMKMWGFAPNDRCKLCGGRETTLHILSGCPKALEGQRYTWRHNNILKFVADQFTGSSHTVTCDLDGYKKYGVTTMPVDCAVTTLIPDLVVETTTELFICELTCPFETNVDKRHAAKIDRYAHFVSDVTRKKVTLLCWEIGARGIVTSENRKTLKAIHKLTNRKLSLANFVKAQTILAITSSHHIFNSRKCVIWTDPGPITHS